MPHALSHSGSAFLLEPRAHKRSTIHEREREELNIGAGNMATMAQRSYSSCRGSTHPGSDYHSPFSPRYCAQAALCLHRRGDGEKESTGSSQLPPLPGASSSAGRSVTSAMPLASTRSGWRGLPGVRRRTAVGAELRRSGVSCGDKLPRSGHSSQKDVEVWP